MGELVLFCSTSPTVYKYNASNYTSGGSLRTGSRLEAWIFN
jgi:hypothetical protein